MLSLSAAAAVGINTSGVGDTSAVSCCDEENTPEDSTNEKSKVEHQGEHVWSQSTSLHWYSSYQTPSTTGWVHDFALSTCVGCEYQDSHWISGDSNEIKSINYEITKMKPDNQKVDMGTNPEYNCVYPKDNDDILPDWVEIPFDLTIGSLHPTIAFALAADDMAEALAPKDGWNYNSDGVDFTHSTSGTLWSDAAYFNRFRFIDEDGHGSDGDLGIDMKVNASTVAAEFAPNPEVEIDVYLFEDIGPTLQTAETDEEWDDYSVYKFGNTAEGLNTVNPSQMSSDEKEVFGVKDVSDKSIKSPYGEEITYVASDLPISVVKKSKKPSSSSGTISREN